MNRESQAIDHEKAKAEQMEKQLESLQREIEQKMLYLNRESQLEIDAYNQKVEAYNKLLKEVEEQTVLVNQLVNRYNQKLRQYSR